MSSKSNSGSKGGGSKQPPDVNYRNAKDGQYVKETYADKHPNTTVKETDKKKGK